MPVLGRNNGRALGVIFVLCLLLVGAFIFWSWWTSNNEAGNTNLSNRNTQSIAQTKSSPVTTTTEQNSRAITDDINTTINAILRAREDVNNSKAAYAGENCAAVEKLRENSRAITASQIIIAAQGKCDEHIKKFDAYQSGLEKLFAQAGGIEQIKSKVESLATIAKNGTSETGSTDGYSWTSLLWVAVASISASLAMFLLITGRSFFNQRDIVAALSQGFTTVNGSLGQLHTALSEEPRQSGRAGAGVEGFAGHRTTSSPGQEAERFAQLSNILSSELRRGFSNLQESLKPISNGLGNIALRLESPPNQQRGVAAMQPAQPSGLPNQERQPSAPPGPMLVADYKKRFSQEASVKPSYQQGYLEKSPEGQLLVLRDERSDKCYLIPREGWLQTPSFFNQDYAAYYDETGLNVGYIKIINPAIVRQEGAQWRLEVKGTLTTQK